MVDIRLDDWYDSVRVAVGVICLITLFVLFKRYRRDGENWNKKTHDLWFSVVMWTFAGLVMTIQGIYLDYIFGPALVFLTAAALTGAKGIFAKGSWGGNDT